MSLGLNDFWCDLSASDVFLRAFKSIKLSLSPGDVVKDGRFMSAIGSVKETDTRRDRNEQLRHLQHAGCS
jgi:hypothetical protein